jgi:hypothetical protein
MPTGVPLPSSIEPEETRWQRILDDRERDGKPLSPESKRGLQAYIRERKESPIILVEIPRAARMGFPTIAGQEVGSGEERTMHVHERMLWMKTRDGGVEGEESNMQKVSTSRGKERAKVCPEDGTDRRSLLVPVIVHLGVHLGLSVCRVCGEQRWVVSYQSTAIRNARKSNSSLNF